MRIVTSDGLTIEYAYANAYDADHRMEGVRVKIGISSNGSITTSVHPDDAEALHSWNDNDAVMMLERMAELAAEGDIDMCDEKGVPSWITTN